LCEKIKLVVFFFSSRPRDKHRHDSPEPELQDLEDGIIFDPIHALRDDRTSTPFDQSIGSVSAISAADPFTQQKISAMEEELAALRSQIAVLIKDQEQTRLPPSMILTCAFFR
jgi:hypothetical protein